MIQELELQELIEKWIHEMPEGSAFGCSRLIRETYFKCIEDLRRLMK